MNQNENENEELTPRQLAGVAQKIREQLQALVRTRTRTVILRTDALYVTQTHLQGLRRKLQVAVTHRWDAAAGKLVRCIAMVIRDLPHQAQNIGQAVETLRMVTVPSARCLLEDLRQLKEEIDGLRYNPKDHTLAVTTESITLDGVYLGHFEIQLHLNRLARDELHSVCDIVALDPHPAGCNSDVMHPHVSDQRLCAGDATSGRRPALRRERRQAVFAMRLRCPQPHR